MVYTGTVVVIPTRNRATIAMNAIRSVLDQPVEDVRILVSDNSTSDSEREDLASFCVSAGFRETSPDERLRYVRPAEPLSMSAHWDWAIHEALKSYPQTSHFLYLTDRMMFRKGALKEVLDLATIYPDKLISYNLDRIIDNVAPIRVEQYPATEKLFEVQTVRLSQLLSQALIHPAVPRMLNCIVPRSVLNRIHERFGTVFSSVSPDFNFCCRCIETEESILYYDKAPIFHYALDRSNGASVSRGEVTADSADFNANLPLESSMAKFATPIPQLNTAVNYAFHEYCLLKQQTNSTKFFELDFQKYLQANAREVPEFVDPRLRAEMLSLLVANGYREGQANGQQNVRAAGFAERLRSKIKRVLTSPATTSAWLFLAHSFAVRPPGYNGFEFATVDEAIDYAKNISRGNVTKGRSHHDVLMARELQKQ